MSIEPNKNWLSGKLSSITQNFADTLSFVFPTLSKKLEPSKSGLDQIFLNFLSQQKLLQGLGPEEILLFSKFITIEEHPQGVNLIEEGENSKDIYFIFEGEASLLKWDEKKFHQISIGSLGQGKVFGEMSFIDGEPRSTTVRTLTKTIVLKFDPENINKKNRATKEIYDAILYNITKTSIRRLRSSNQDYVKSLRSQVEFGYFFIIAITIFGIGNVFFLLALNYNLNTRLPSISWLGLTSLLIPYLILLYYFQHPLKDFGITTENMKKSVTEGVIISLSLIVLTSFGYWVYTLSEPGAPSLLHTILNPKQPFTIFTLLYFFHGYLQEFMARGITQGSLQKFLNDKKGLKTLLLSGIMFGVLHLSRGFEAGVVASIGSLFFGAIYLRHHNLMGVAIVHYVTGIIVMSYLGLI